MADVAVLDDELAGLDALELDELGHRRRLVKAWSAVWPKLLAAAIGLGLWQLIVLSGWRPDYALPGPNRVLPELWHQTTNAEFWKAIAITMRRALTGYAIAVVLGSLIGTAVTQSRVLRSGVGALITGVQTMPSIAWFPLAILLFKLSETAILFVVVLGAAPSIANGLINGVDNVPPLLVRAGRSLGARGLELYRHVVLPASMPSFVAGLKQGWAFAWRSLMAGELIVIVAHRPSIGAKLQNARDLNDAQGLMALMIVVLVIGIVMDSVFTRIEGTIRARWGLIDNSTA